MKIKVNNKVVGEVVDNTFIKNLNSDKHFLKKPPAIAFDISSLNNASISGAVYVKINDTKTDDIYTASIKNIFRKGFEFNRGFGKQVALPLQMWHIKNNSQKELNL
jgi:hypothetical protein